MAFPQTTQSVPLDLTPDGSIRVQGTRVSLDSIVRHFQLGATAEEIAHKFPTLNLADIYSVIAFYLNNREAIADYLTRQASDEEALQEQLDAHYHASITEVRDRLLLKRTQRS